MIKRLKMKPAGIREMLTHPKTAAMISDMGQKVADAAGPGFESKDFVKGNRARSVVMAKTEEARRVEAEEGVLLSALWAARRR
ncbi:MAG: hypothetical protein WAS05_00790 [Candidatus Nanopelagicales bacterium]